MRKRKRFSVKISSDVSVIVCRYCHIFPYGDRFALVELCNQCSEETEEEKEAPQDLLLGRLFLLGRELSF